MWKHFFPLILAFASTAFALSANAKPYAEGVFRGRIAHSADGNANDEDDWAAFPRIS